MKKFASVLLAVLVAFSMFSFVVSAAAPSLTVSADKTTVNAGDKVKVTVSLSENSQLGNLVFDVLYNKDAFKVVSTFILSDDESDNAPRPLFSMEEKNPKTAGSVRYAGINAKPVTKAGTLIVITLEALKAVDSEVTVDVIEASDDAYADVAVAAGKVSFKGFVEAPSEKPSETPSEKPSEEPSTEKPSEKPSEEPSTDKPTEPEDPCKDGRHDYSEYIVTKKACANQTGEKQRSCKVCGNIEKEAIAKNGKCEPGAWVVTKQPTKTAEGEKVQKCKICGEVLQRAKMTKLPSDPITNPAIPNTDAQA